MAKPDKKDKVKVWYVFCTVCAGGQVESKLKPTQCPNNPAHPIRKVERLDEYPQNVIMTSPDGSKWMVYIENNGQLRTEKV